MTIETIQPESETKKTFIKPFSARARYAKQRKPSWTFLCSSKVCEKKFDRIFATVPESPPFLSNRSLPPYPPTIDRITKQRYKPRAKPKNQEQKRKKGKPMHKRTKNETKRKKKIKITTCMLFSSLLKHTHKRNTYFFSFINGQQKPSKWPINLQNMPNGVAKHAKPRHERCPFAMPNMPNRETYLFIWVFLCILLYLYMPFNVFMFVYIFTHRK